MNEGLIVALKLLAVLILVLANGFFVAAEFALVAVRRTRIDELVSRGNVLARAAQRAVRDLDRYIAATQLGITMASLALGFLGEPTLGRLLEGWLGHAVPGGHTLAIAIAFAVITALHIIVGELAPKSIALQYPEQTALSLATPLEIFLLVFQPFILLLNGAGRLAVRMLGLTPAAGHELVHSSDELKMLVEASGKAGVLDEAERDLLSRAFLLGEFEAHEMMLPRTEVVAIPVAASGRDLLAQAQATGFSRFPVYEGSLDNVLGVVHVKDVLRAVLDDTLDNFSVQAVMRPALFIPESAPADDLLGQMRAQGIHMACVVDEFGGLAGIVTFERVLERLVGVVRDEFEPREEPVLRQPDGSYLVNGLVLISELNEQLGLALDDREYDTIGGLTFGLVGHKPSIGDCVQTGDTSLEVVELDGLRIARVKLQTGVTSA